MTEAEHRRLVEDFCDAALKRSEGDRAAFVGTACDGDEELRNEVEALLLHAERADRFLTGSIGELAADILERSASLPVGNAQTKVTTSAKDAKRSFADSAEAEIQESFCNVLPLATPTAIVTVDDHPKSTERYGLVRLHATGGIGRIWLARDTAFDRDVALKELRPEHAALDIHRARFVQEARITGQLEHPGIVPVYELASRLHDQQPFYVMRFVKGRTLAEAARNYHHNRVQGQAEMLDFVTLLNAFVAVCNTIAYTHARGVIHRDLKGENVVLGDFGEVVVLDWGLAKLVGREEADADDALRVIGSREASLTVHGQAIGTPGYMAPEQASGDIHLIDQRTDLYGLGAILYEILTGVPPFSGPDTLEILRKVREDQPVTPRDLWPDVPPALEGICLHALAKNPRDRFPSASELARAVQSWQEIERREAQEERDRFFTLSLDMLCIAGFDGFFKRLNPAFERTLGFTVDEMLAEPFLSFVHPDDKERTAAEVPRLMGGGDTIWFENRYRCKDGSYKWLLWTATAYADRQLIYAAARDNTAQKQTVDALQRSEGRYRSVIAAMQAGIVLLDADGSIRACNGSAERILGLSGEQLRGRTALDPRWRAIHEDGSPFPSETFPAAVTLRTGQPCFNTVMGVYKPDGNLTWISINSEPLFEADGSTLAGVVTSLEDITERRRTEIELKHAATELARLRHYTSH